MSAAVVYRIAFGAAQETLVERAAPIPERKLASKPSQGPSCRGGPSFPVNAVRYIPRMVGEPYPHPESDPWGYYGHAYEKMHDRDLPIIGNVLGADTVALSPWPTVGMEGQHRDFFLKMRGAGVCKMVPTFHVAKYYADMLRQGLEKPKTDPSSPFAVDFTRFAASLNNENLKGAKMVAWTLDLSLDLKDVLPQVGDSCEYSAIRRDTSFQKYSMLLDAIQNWVHPADPNKTVAPALQKVPLLVPLDVSRAPWNEPAFNAKMKLFLQCMSRSYSTGGWSTLFTHSDVPQEQRTRWLLSFETPLQRDSRNFQDLLLNSSTWLKEEVRENSNGLNAIVMVGAQALKPGGSNPINSLNLLQDNNIDNSRYAKLYNDYSRIQAVNGNLDGFIYDEWMDDWDRGIRGAFFLARKNLEEMKDSCEGGGRFTHDTEGCSREVGSNAPVYPEYFGLAASSSQFFRHCLHPRFDRSIFGAPNTSMRKPRKECVFMVPSGTWMLVSGVCFTVVVVLQVMRMLSRWCRDSHEPKKKKSDEKKEEEQVTSEPKVGFLKIAPEEAQLCGNHLIELTSTRLSSNEEAGWWLWMHASTQMSILERQVKVEMRATRSMRQRRYQLSREGTRGQSSASLTSDPPAPDVPEEDVQGDLVKAMQVVHRRTLEGFAAWCTYVAGAGKRSICRSGPDADELRKLASQIEDNSVRPPANLFAETLLLRVMECLGEQILQCPERIAYLLFGIIQEAGGLEESGPLTFSIDFERLQDGLPQMNNHTNPYVLQKNPRGKWELGLNFDDINECGIQCRDTVTKTFKEPASIMVVLDFFLCYRVPFMIKMYCLLLAGYIYLGSHQGDDITTTHNGSFLNPKWLRLNYIQWSASLDGVVWVLIESVLVVYVLWQRWPSLCHRSPGIPGLQWLCEHMLNLFVSALGGVVIYSYADLREKPWACAQSDGGTCVDPRSDELWTKLQYSLMYWACRVILFVVMNSKKVPIFIYGTPDSKLRRNSGRGWWEELCSELRVNLAWFCMLGLCIFLEVVLLLPTMKGLDLDTTCGLSSLGQFTGLPSQDGVCMEADQRLTYGCVTCVSAVSAGWLLVFIGSLVDIYFVFYFASAAVGSVMGHRRHLNDLKNTSLPIDLRPNQGREAKLFETTFGPGWQQVWKKMVESLAEESLISPKQATGLVQAAGISMHGTAPLTHRERKEKPIHLTRFPHLASQRLAFFFQSLKWIENFKPSKGMEFKSSVDALTGDSFDPGSIPSVTQIIPAYNEVVIPAVEFLRAGAEPEDARNSSPDDQPGLGDLTIPPQGDGVNTNLGFMISQFPDEWVFLVKRLQHEGRIDGDSQEFYQKFLQSKTSPDCVIEIRLWAALRMQSVAKTVMGALQYGRALASLPKIKEYYEEERKHFPEKRTPEDHVEVILAHQTYGHSEGMEKNDEAVQMLLERYADDPLYMVFDLKKGSSKKLWDMVDAFLKSHGGFGTSSFEQASVKCKWDKARSCLKVLEVLPRKFALRLGQGDYKTQGKACNQLNGLRFASGHYVQALDCNMGCFIGEGFKIPYVLRMFIPPDQDDRAAPRCRYLGFREVIYTAREGTVGKCHAAAEWTFGTIYQRFLSGMDCRMHYGHPDFLDGFWARNRGGMSKSSPVVNLSEDIFAGFNVRMREEKSPHIDALEFEKGREATFNAASNFFSKIAGGSVSVIRSRDNHLLCERIGLLHSFSFYFTSVAFYTSNLLVDLSTYLYVILFILFNLAGLGPGELHALGSTFSTEWIISMGLVSLFPQLAEMILEFGAVHAVKEVIGGMFSATFFFIFQNKNIASAMKEGATTGIARYFFTGRPMANQHQTWKDIYIAYWKSHYKPAMFLATAYTIYSVIAVQNRSEGKLPMVLVVVSMMAWVVTPIVFSPFSRFILIGQDIQEFNTFINSHAGTAEHEISEVISRGKKGTVRSLYETGLADELCVWSEQHFFMLGMGFLIRAIIGVYLLTIVPAEILDYLPVYICVLSLSWVVVLGYFAAGLNNVFLVFSFLIWIPALPFSHYVIGDRATSPTWFARVPEYVISLTVFFYFLDLAKNIVLIWCRLFFCSFACCSDKTKADRRLHECIRVCFVYFFVHQMQAVEAYIIMCANVVVSMGTATIDLAFCNAHTWWLLNSEMARTKRGERYMEKNATFFELDGLRPGFGSDLFSSGSDSEFEDEIPDSLVRSWA